jgi:hypothetical protein
VTCRSALGVVSGQMATDALIASRNGVNPNAKLFNRVKLSL